MKINNIAFLGAVFYLLSSSVYAQPEKRVPYTPDQYLKNYALSGCIASGYQSDEIKKDATTITDGYFELGEYSIEAYQAVDKLKNEFLAKNYQSKSEQQMILAKCIDLFHSQQLEDIINEYKNKKE